ncbi:MAG: hypothetical protein FJZ10_04815 [Candidatus Omnitrophica bacterium]|nr:hypothetical protein [Candidatus Omnitrophota bacterium]
MDIKIKRIVAREGLVAILIIIVAIFTGHNAYNFFWKYIAPQLNPDVYFVYPTRTLKGAILGNIISLYLIYLLFWAIVLMVRFILWAIRTLKQK